MDFDNYVARIASKNSPSQDGFQSPKEKELLKEAIQILTDAGFWWRDILSNQQAYLQLNLDALAPTTSGAYASPAKGNRFYINISIEFIHEIVRFGVKNMASLPMYKEKNSIMSAVSLILFHELSHVIFGHTETVMPSIQDYRIDESNADFNSGMIFAKSATQCDLFRTRLNFYRPDDISRYMFIGALLLHRCLYEIGSSSPLYHGANNRFKIMCAGYMYMATGSRLSDPHRLQPIMQAIERDVQESRDPGWQQSLRQDINDNLQMLTVTMPNYHERANKYNENSFISGSVLKKINVTKRFSDPAVQRLRTFFGNETNCYSTVEANVHREARSRIILADKATRSTIDLNSITEPIIIVEFGRRGDLTDEEASKAAEFMIRVANVRPNTLMSIAIGGFDDDPRRITDIPECANHLRRLYLEVKRRYPKDGNPSVWDQLESQSRVLLDIAMGYAPRDALDIKPTEDIEIIAQFWTDILRIRQK